MRKPFMKDKPHKTRIENCQGKLAEPRESYGKWAYWWGTDKGGWHSRPEGALTAEYEKQIQDRAADTWQSIGFDVLQASGIPSTSGKCLRRSVVIEIVLGHLRSAGDMGEWGPRSTKIDFTQFDSLSYNQKVNLLKKAFPDTEYGY
jgi:hypothetical protein